MFNGKEMSNMSKSQEMDMLNGGLAGKLILFAIPLAFSSILQQLFNSADVAVVGRFAGSTALAAVGSCAALVGIFVNLITGLSVGPNAVLANLIGQNKRDQISSMVHTILSFSLILGIFLMLVGMVSAKPILELSGTPDSVIDQSLLYFRIYCLSVPFMLIYNFGGAILRSYGDSKRPMYYLLISGVLNVILNLIFVIGAHLGVAGVALATWMANILSASLVVIHLHRRQDEFGFSFRKIHIDQEEIKRIMSIGVPSGIQGAIFSVSNVFIQSGINSYGENAIAGSSLAINFEYFSYALAVAFAQASVTFTSQNFGAGNIKRCKKIFWQCMVFGIFFSELLSMIFMIWDDFFVGIYTTSAAVAAFGISRLHQVCSLEGLTATYEVESAALRGMGKSIEPSVVTILGTVVFRLIWLVTIYRIWPSFEMLMWVYVASWIFTGGILFVIYMMHMKKIEKRIA